MNENEMLIYRSVFAASFALNANHLKDDALPEEKGQALQRAAIIASCAIDAIRAFNKDSLKDRGAVV